MRRERATKRAHLRRYSARLKVLGHSASVAELCPPRIRVCRWNPNADSAVLFTAVSPVSCSCVPFAPSTWACARQAKIPSVMTFRCDRGRADARIIDVSWNQYNMARVNFSLVRYINPRQFATILGPSPNASTRQSWQQLHHGC
jgi:hypothetical protein